MRVVWISIGIFVAVFVIAVGTHEPDTELQNSSAIESKSEVENPFVEGVSEESQVQVAALSANQQSENQQSDIAADETSNQAAEVAQNQVDNPNNQSTPETNIAGDIAAEQSDASPQKKPLGLLARSAQKRRNENKVAVIVHAENDQQITEHEIRAMYMDRLTQWKDGSKIMLYNLPLGDKHREKFSQRVLNMSALQADEAESIRRDNNVATNSVHVKAKNIVVSYVERYPNAIAYVPLTMIRDKSRVKVVMTLADD